MNEVKTTLKRMAVYYLLLAVNIVFSLEFFNHSFPVRNLPTIYLLVLSVCLILYYAHRVTPTGGLSVLMKGLSVMGLLLIFLRGVKYSAFAEVGALARHTWYLYYVPILLLPLFLFYVSLLVSSKERAHIPKAWYWTLAVTVALVVLVLTNDLHRQVFDFRADFADWDGDYTRGWLFYVLTAWQFALYLAAIVVLVVKCRVGDAKKNAWLIAIPLALGVVMYALLFVDTIVIEFPEAHLFTVAVVLECCMQLGLIPTNTDYGKLFRNLSISAQITDRKGTPVYVSATATPISADRFALPEGARIGEHTVLHKMAISGGYGFWQDDMTALDRLNDELAEAKEGLAEEVELIRLRNELRAKQTKIEQRTRVYDAIARRTQRQSQTISRWAEAARSCDDVAVKDAYRRRVTFLGAYIKRYANLMLLAEESDCVEVGELGLLVSETLRYLNYCGIPSEHIGGTVGKVPSAAALAVFEAFEWQVETNLARLAGVFVNLSIGERVLFKAALENAAEDLSPEAAEKLRAAGVTWESKREDDVTYVCYALPKGEEP